MSNENCTKLVLPEAESYQAEDVLHGIAAVAFPCSYKNLACNQCERFKAYKAAMYRSWRNPPEKLECDELLQERKLHMDYLAQRIYDDVVCRVLDLWSEDLKKATRPYKSMTELAPSLDNIASWVKQSYVLRRDVIGFCERENISIEFVGEDGNTVEPGNSQDVMTVHEYSIEQLGVIAQPEAYLAQQELTSTGQEGTPEPVAEMSPPILSTPSKSDDAPSGRRTEPSDTQVKETLVDPVNKTTPSTLSTLSKSDDGPPGKIPNTSMGKLAVKAAWQIECELERKASAREVITRLQEWANNKKEADHADLTGIVPHGVKWMTSTLVEKDYTIDTCRKALKTWHESRAWTTTGGD